RIAAFLVRSDYSSLGEAFSTRLFNFCPELWPTHLRLRGSGFVNAVGRIVAVFTPYGVAALLTHYGSITVFMVLGVMLVLCALVLSIFGIETRKVSLEEISEVN
ncbi:MFS transporter, partial [Shigella flexneri]|uniref:MFS transporter n=1 Tax=Shigella flexneri TaxID=623 RepID=UPI0012E758A3